MSQGLEEHVKHELLTTNRMSIVRIAITLIVITIGIIAISTLYIKATVTIDRIAIITINII